MRFLAATLRFLGPRAARPHRRGGGNSSPRRIIGRHGLQFEPLEERNLLTVSATGIPAWVEQGPITVRSTQDNLASDDYTAGAVQSIAINPANKEQIYVGTVNGGIWKTDKASEAMLHQAVWTPLTDQQASLAIGSIAFSPLDPDNKTLFAGTGSFSGLSNQGGPAIGILRTTDGGTTWSTFPLVLGGPQPKVKVVLPTSINLADNGSPVNQLVLVGTVGGGGLFRSNNNGEHYDLVKAGPAGVDTLPAGDVTQLIADPNNVNQFYVAVAKQGIYRGVFNPDKAANPDRSITWTEINAGLSGVGMAGNIQIAAQDTGTATTLFALLSGPAPSAYRLADGSSTWTTLAAPPPSFATDSTTGPGNNIIADPSDDKIVYIATAGSNNIFRYNPAGNGTWVGITNGGAMGNTFPHPDSRDMAFAGSTLVEADSGGIFYLTNPKDAANNAWETFNGNGDHGISNVEIHDIVYDPIANNLVAGTQDNGTLTQTAPTPVPNNLTWDEISAGNGGAVGVDTFTLAATSKSIRYFSGTPLATNFFRQEVTAANNVAAPVPLNLPPAAFVPQDITPFKVNAVANTVANKSTRVVIGGGTDATHPNGTIFESDDAGVAAANMVTWTQVTTPAGFGNVTALAYGGKLNNADNPDILYVGANNATGPGAKVYVRTTAGGTLDATAAFPGAEVRDIILDPKDWRHAFVISATGIWETTNNGATWLDRKGNLSSADLRTVQFVPLASGYAVLVGGLGGVFRMLSNTPGTWTEMGSGMPNTVTYDLDYNKADDVLVAGTLGRGAFLIPTASQAIAGAGILTITGDADYANEDDAFRIVRDPNDPSMVQVYINDVLQDIMLNGGTVTSVPLASLQQINVWGAGGDDSLTVDSTNGLITVPGGIRFDGDNPQPGQANAGIGGVDQLLLRQDTPTVHVSTTVFVGNSSGNGKVETTDGPGLTQSITFQNIEPIFADIPDTDFYIKGQVGLASLLQASNNITFGDGELPGAPPGTTRGRVTIDTFEPIEFTNQGTVHLSAGTGNDNVVFYQPTVLPTGLIGYVIDGEDGNDTIDASALVGVFVSLSGGNGNDTLLGGSDSDLLSGGAGNDFLDGGGTSDIVTGGDGDDTIVASPTGPGSLAEAIDAGAGTNTLLIRGTSGNDTIYLNQTSATTLTYVLGTSNAVVSTNLYFFGDVPGPAAKPTIQIVQVEAGDGDDTILVNVADSLVSKGAGPNGSDLDLGSLAYRIDGGAPNASDRLIVNDDGKTNADGDLVVQRLGADGQSGSVTVGPFKPVDYTGIEHATTSAVDSTTGTQLNDNYGGRVLVIPPDPKEPNDVRTTATLLGAAPTFLTGLSIAPGGVNAGAPFGVIGGDQDWFQFTPTTTGTYRFEALYNQIGPLPNGRQGLPDKGDLVISVSGLAASPGNPQGTLTPIVTDAAGAVIPNSLDLTAFTAKADISMTAGKTYFIKVAGQGTATNLYSLRVSQIDTLGPQVTNVFMPAHDLTPAFPLLTATPEHDGPTPLVKSIEIDFRDLLNSLAGGDMRADGDIYAALASTAKLAENYRLVGDYSGVIPIQSVVVAQSIGKNPTAQVILSFASALPDDRYTLTVFDSLTDPVGNRLDGEINAVTPLVPVGTPGYHSGDGNSGGNFVARFTVDSRPELAVYGGGNISADLNGNLSFDPQNPDPANHDNSFQFGLQTDQRFVGKFGAPSLGFGTRFDVLAAYGRANGQFRFLIDFNGNGVVDNGEYIVSPFQVDGLAVAGNFSGSPGSADEIALFDGTKWYVDVLHPANTTIFTSPVSGYPIAGDFDGDQRADLGTYRNDTFYLLLAANNFANPQVISFGAPGTLERPVAADMDGDGITDIGLWVPYDATASATGHFRFLLSAGRGPAPGSAYALNHAFQPAPFGSDLSADFGDPRGLPLIGNFDPPGVSATSAPPTATSTVNATSAISPASISTTTAQTSGATTSGATTSSDAGAGDLSSLFLLGANSSSTTTNTAPTTTVVTAPPPAPAPQLAAPAVTTTAPTTTTSATSTTTTATTSATTPAPASNSSAKPASDPVVMAAAVPPVADKTVSTNTNSIVAAAPITTTMFWPQAPGQLLFAPIAVIPASAPTTATTTQSGGVEMWGIVTSHSGPTIMVVSTPTGTVVQTASPVVYWPPAPSQFLNATTLSWSAPALQPAQVDQFFGQLADAKSQ